MRDATPSGSAECSATCVRTWAAHEPEGETTASYPANVSTNLAASADATSGMAGVQVQLPATGLLAGELDLHPEPLQEGDGRPTHGRLERVDKAGDEQRHAHRASVQQRRPFDR